MVCDLLHNPALHPIAGRWPAPGEFIVGQRKGEMKMATQSFFSPVFKGLSDGLFKVEIRADPGLTQEIKKLFGNKKACLAFKKLAGNDSVTVVYVPGEYGNAFLPPGLYEVQQNLGHEDGIRL